MDRIKFQILVLAVIAAVYADFAAADELDDALAAEKKKAGRRAYTDSALLHDRQLEVPKAPSETEKAAEKDFYQSGEERLNTAPKPASKPGPPPPVAIPPKDKNWLTPALMNDEENADDTLQWTNLPETAALHDPAFLFPKGAREEETVDRLVRERLQQASPASNPRQFAPDGFQDLQPEAALQNVYQSRSDRDSSAPSYLKPADISRPNLLPAVALPGRKPAAFGTGLPAPNAAVAGSAPAAGAYQTWGTPLNPLPGIPAQREPLDMLNRQTAPLSPLQQIRKSSPINQRDPFGESYMPEFKKSIWE